MIWNWKVGRQGSFICVIKQLFSLIWLLSKSAHSASSIWPFSCTYSTCTGPPKDYLNLRGNWCSALLPEPTADFSLFSLSQNSWANSIGSGQLMDTLQGWCPLMVGGEGFWTGMHWGSLSGAIRRSSSPELECTNICHHSDQMSSFLRYVFSLHFNISEIGVYLSFTASRQQWDIFVDTCESTDNKHATVKDFSCLEKSPGGTVKHHSTYTVDLTPKNQKVVGRQLIPYHRQHVQSGVRSRL